VKEMEKKIKQVIDRDKEINDEPKLSITGDINQPEVTLVKSQSSVQIETDSKGIKKYSVKVYDDDPYKAACIALEIVERVEEKLNEKGDE
jgi:hypothetical protein